MELEQDLKKQMEGMDVHEKAIYMQGYNQGFEYARSIIYPNLPKAAYKPNPNPTYFNEKHD